MRSFRRIVNRPGSWRWGLAASLACAVLLGLGAQIAQLGPLFAHAEPTDGLRFERGYYVDRGLLCYGWSGGSFHCTRFWRRSQARLFSENAAWVPNYGTGRDALTLPTTSATHATRPPVQHAVNATSLVTTHTTVTQHVTATATSTATANPSTSSALASDTPSPMTTASDDTAPDNTPTNTATPMNTPTPTKTATPTPQPTATPTPTSNVAAATPAATTATTSGVDTAGQPCHSSDLWASQLSQWAVPPSCYGAIYSPNTADYVSRPGFGYCNWWVLVLNPSHPDLLSGSEYTRTSVPAPGDAVSFSPNVQGASSNGHFAQVVAVSPGGYWVLVTEMNFVWRGGGFGKVDYRYIHTGAGVTFIVP